jgi:hypothetical protein
MEEKSFQRRARVISGSVIILINLVILVGSMITRNPYEILWVSHYAGILGGIVLINNFNKPVLNGMYSFLFILQLGSVVTHIINPVNETYLDILYWFNHLPHFIGFYLLAKKEYSAYGVHLGFVFMLFLTNLSFQILYTDSLVDPLILGYEINTVYREYFIYVILLALAWYIILLILIKKKSYKKRNEK